MKIAVFSFRRDEEGYFEKFQKKYSVEIKYCREALTEKTIHIAEGADAVSIITTPVSEELIKGLHDLGIRFISTRTIGYEHIDLEAAKKYQIGVGNVTYSPYSVADYTIMLILMALRKVNVILNRYSSQDFTLRGVQGRELHNLTVGVVGTGKIGRTVIKELKGFGCSILAYDILAKDSIKDEADFVELDHLLAESDIITLHVPSTKENYHLIDQEAIIKMKTGVILVNTARGPLIDHKALIQGLEEGKIGGAALDVIENEAIYYYQDYKDRVITHQEMAILRSMPNVILTPHTAFYTDQAVSDMVENSIASCVLEIEGREILISKDNKKGLC